MLSISIYFCLLICQKEHDDSVVIQSLTLLSNLMIMKLFAES